MSLIQQGIVEDLLHDGIGLVKIDGKVYLFDGVWPGEIIQFEDNQC